MVKEELKRDDFLEKIRRASDKYFMSILTWGEEIVAQSPIDLSDEHMYRQLRILKAKLAS